MCSPHSRHARELVGYALTVLLSVLFTLPASVSAAAASAQQQLAALLAQSGPGASLLGDDPIAALSLPTGQAAAATPIQAAVDDRTPVKALRFSVPAAAEPAWNVQAAAKTSAPVKKGDVVLIMLYVRALPAPDKQPDARGRIGLVLERSGPGWEKTIEESAQCTADWQLVCAGPRPTSTRFRPRPSTTAGKSPTPRGAPRPKPASSTSAWATSPSASSTAPARPSPAPRWRSL